MNKNIIVWIQTQVEKAYESLILAKTNLIGILIKRLFLIFILGCGAVTVYISGYRIEYGHRFNLITVAKDLYGNLSSELIGILITVALIDSFSQARQVRSQREQLVMQLASPNNAIAREAVRVAKHKGWHRDGTLWGKNLHKANLMGANLQNVDLRRSLLNKADLSSSLLYSTNFTRCGLQFVNLSEAEIVGAVFHDADLTGTNLKGVTFIEPWFNQQTVMPDGTNWYQGIDLERFTDENHSDFWRSRSPLSPAYEATS